MRSPATNRSATLGRRARATLTAVLCAAGLLALDPSRALSQPSPGPVAGSRVRITSTRLRLKAAVGTVQEDEGDALLVQFHNPRLLVRLEPGDITQMDVSVERHRRTLKGLGSGALVGAGGGALLGLASGDDPPDTFIAFSATEKAAMFGVFFGALGAVVGLVTGATTWSDVWEPAAVTSPPATNLSLAPFTSERGTGARIGVSLTLR